MPVEHRSHVQLDRQSGRFDGVFVPSRCRRPQGRSYVETVVRRLAVALLASTLLLLVQPLDVAAASVSTPLGWVSWSPFLPGENPAAGAVLTEAQIAARLQDVAPYAKGIRTFGCQNLPNVGRLARTLGLDVALQAWIGPNAAANQAELTCLINAVNAGDADVAIVGSEVLLRRDQSPAALVSLIQQVRSATGGIVPVASADTYVELLNNPEVLAAGDVVLANVYAYWEKVAVENAAAHLYRAYKSLVAAAAEREIWIAEAGWPSSGQVNGAAVPVLG